MLHGKVWLVLVGLEDKVRTQTVQTKVSTFLVQQFLKSSHYAKSYMHIHESMQRYALNGLIIVTFMITYKEIKQLD